VSRSETRSRGVSWGFAAGSGAWLGRSPDGLVDCLPLGEVPARLAGGAGPVRAVQGRRIAGAAPREPGAAPPAQRSAAVGSRRPSLARGAVPAGEPPTVAGSLPRSPRPRSCAGTAISSRASGTTPAGAGQDGHPPGPRSRRWSSGWRARTRPGGTGGFRVSGVGDPARCGYRACASPGRADLAGVPGRPGSRGHRLRLPGSGDSVAQAAVRAGVHRARHPQAARRRGDRAPSCAWRPGPPSTSTRRCPGPGSVAPDAPRYTERRARPCGGDITPRRCRASRSAAGCRSASDRASASGVRGAGRSLFLRSPCCGGAARCPRRGGCR
jgi:hypothetical protein